MENLLQATFLAQNCVRVFFGRGIFLKTKKLCGLNQKNLFLKQLKPAKKTPFITETQRQSMRG
jgi:hypothetical protein